MTVQITKQIHLVLLLVVLGPLSYAVPAQGSARSLDGIGDLRVRQDGPLFPNDPPSCPVCARDYWNINSCCQAVPVLANFTNVIFNPGAFIEVIKCACVDTFQSAYPQCADCLQRTGQEAFLFVDADDVPGIVVGIRNVCAISSILLGNVSGANGELTPSHSTSAPASTSLPSHAEIHPLPPRWEVLSVLVTISAVLLAYS